MPREDAGVIVIRGGLPGEVDTATARHRRWQRVPGETEAEFLDRLAQEAEDSRIWAIAGGLPDV